MPNKVNIKGLVGGIAKRSHTIGLSTFGFKKKVNDALVGAGYNPVKAGKIATGLRSGTANLSRKEAIKVLKTLRQTGVIKSPIRSFSGEVDRFTKSQNASIKSSEHPESLEKEKIQAREARLRIRERAQEIETEMASARTVSGMNDANKSAAAVGSGIQSMAAEAESNDLPLD